MSPAERQRKVFLLILGCFGFFLFLVLSVVIFGGRGDSGAADDRKEAKKLAEAKSQEDGDSQEQGSSGAAEEATTPPPDLPLFPLEPERVDAIDQRPSNWARLPLRDNRGRNGNGQASSELREGGSGTVYAQRNLTDKRSRTSWCEAAEGSGARRDETDGEWFQVAVACRDTEAEHILGLEIVSGFGTKKSEWKKNNRIEEARLQVTLDGEEKLVAKVILADRMGSQFVEFPGAVLCKRDKTIRARMEIISVYQGDQYTDTCVSQIALYPRGK